MTPAEGASDDDPRRDTALYLWVWRWHFFAGLLVAPVLIVLAVTGGLYLFDDEIEGWWYRDLVWVAPIATPAPPEFQERVVLAAHPGARLLRYSAPASAERAAEWQLRTASGEPRTVFVDPASGALLGELATDRRLMHVIRSLHGELLLGRFGNLLVELAACWTFVLLVTGLYLWWPRSERSGGVFWPRLGARGRLLLRDLHAVPSLWNGLLVGFLVLSGLPWSGFWGEQVARLGTLAPALAATPNFRAAPAAPSAADVPPRVPVHDHDAALGELPWAVRKAGVPVLHAPHAARIPLARVMREARARGLDAPGLSVIYPQSARSVFTLSFVPAKAQAQRTVHLDPRTGAVIEDVGWAQYSGLGKAVELGVMTHVGEQFGRANQLVLAASCALVVATVVLGVLAWWRRRPAGALAAPSAPVGFRPRAGVVAVAVALGSFFPLAGASMLVALGFDVLATRRPRAAA
jgi:uncharacterized iron-regulated membrane protein